MKVKLLVLLLLLFSSQALPAQQKQSQNLVLILIDGYRWQELFHGAEQDLLNAPEYNSMDSLERMKKFWAEDADERRKKLMPFTWKYVAKHGQIYGNRDLGNKVNVKNSYWISYPGRAEVLSGFVDKQINSNDYGNNTNLNVLEFLNTKKGYKDKVVTIACWDATGRCLNKENSNMLINVPWEDLEGDHLTEPEILANEIQHYAPKTFGIVERLDFEVYALAKAYIMAKHPKVIYLDFGDTDEYAHAGKYDSYLEDIHHLDDMIKKLWEMMQQDPFYKGNTTFFIVPDHGRGLGSQWTSHGSSVPHSDETWFMVLGPDVKSLGEVKSSEQIYQTQFAGTIAKLLGFNYSVGGKETGEVIEGVLK